MQALAGEQGSRIAIGDGQRVAIAAITGFEFALEVGGPQVVGCRGESGGFAGMADAAALALLRHQAVTLEEVADRGAMRQ